ncbi:hypothetical protein NMG60_11028459 [Bertholletia excelsa]
MELTSNSCLLLFFNFLCLDINVGNFFSDNQLFSYNLFFSFTKWLSWNNTKTQNNERRNSSSNCFYEKKAIIFREDFNRVMENLGMPCDPDDEMLTEKQLLASFEEEEPNLGEVRAAFDVFDVNGDGFIDAGELHSVLYSLGLLEEGSQVENCQRMISGLDENEDGLIDFSEFVKLMEKCFC